MKINDQNTSPITIQNQHTRELISARKTSHKSALGLVLFQIDSDHNTLAVFARITKYGFRFRFPWSQCPLPPLPYPAPSPPHPLLGGTVLLLLRSGMGYIRIKDPPPKRKRKKKETEKVTILGK